MNRTDQSVAEQLHRRPPDKRLLTRLAVLATAAVLLATSVQAQHGHLNAGAVGTTYGDQLLWANGSIFATNSGYVQSMSYATSGSYNGYYNGGPTLTALPATEANLGPAANHAALGTVIQVEMTLLSSPEGGSFAFWESGSLTPTYSLTPGMTSSLWELSDTVAGAGAAGADPYGHLHGRRFTATLPGQYLVGFQLYDTSDLQPGATPFHTPSDMHYMMFSAVMVPEPSIVTVAGLGLGGVLWQLVARRRRRAGD